MKVKQYFNRLSSQQGSRDFYSRTPWLILSKLTQGRTIFGQGKLLKAASVWSSLYWTRIEGLGNNDFSGYYGGLGFGRRWHFRECSSYMEQFLIHPKKNPISAITPQKPGYIFVSDFRHSLWKRSEFLGWVIGIPPITHFFPYSHRIGWQLLRHLQDPKPSP